MIEGKYRFKDEETWNYKDFNSEEEFIKFLEEESKEVEEYKSRPKVKTNPIKNWFLNLKNTKKNWKKVRASPYASLTLGLKARKIIVGLLVPYLLYMTYRMIKNYHATGLVGTLGKLFTIGVMIFICWKIYSTIPAAKKQIEYYKKYPHTINYCPTNTKESVDDILKKIKDNQIKQQEVKKDVGNKEQSTSTSKKGRSSTAD